MISFAKFFSLDGHLVPIIQRAPICIVAVLQDTTNLLLCEHKGHQDVVGRVSSLSYGVLCTRKQVLQYADHCDVLMVRAAGK